MSKTDLKLTPIFLVAFGHPFVPVTLTATSTASGTASALLRDFCSDSDEVGWAAAGEAILSVTGENWYCDRRGLHISWTLFLHYLRNAPSRHTSTSGFLNASGVALLGRLGAFWSTWKNSIVACLHNKPTAGQQPQPATTSLVGRSLLTVYTPP